MAKFTQKTKAHYESIRDLEALIRKAEYIEELYKRQHAAAKRKRESLCIRLRTLIRDDQLKLPGLEDDDTDLGDDGGWKMWAVNMAIHDQDCLSALAKAGIESLGQLAEFMEGDKGLTSIEGIGEHQEMTITEQLKMFWESNPGLDSKE